MTRFSPLHRESIEIDGFPVYTIDGTPADCINVGIYHLCGSKPDLVVSGINAGLNAGIGFVVSSGTIGACLEANIAGIPGIAFSQMFDSETMNRYSAEYALPERVAQRLQQQAGLVIDRVMNFFEKQPQLLSPHLTWNINLPFFLDGGTEIRVCSVGHSYYGSCYRANGGTYSHDLKDVNRDQDPECDTAMLQRGAVTVTPLDLRTFGSLAGKEKSRLQKLFDNC